ncbi:MAG: hypothetical protein MUC99_12810 [Anaerolineae bacterium]|nr:hypothetical protein [Anaerolineae bacterium]
MRACGLECSAQRAVTPVADECRLRGGGLFLGGAQALRQRGLFTLQAFKVGLARLVRLALRLNRRFSGGEVGALSSAAWSSWVGVASTVGALDALGARVEGSGVWAWVVGSTCYRLVCA